jgi:RimJ/RimL family protein N-acetyltransferase
MIHALNKTDYEKARPLFQPLTEYLLFCTGVLEGKYPGRVFVDDPAHPRTAFMITRDMWCFLAGDPHNDAFNRALNAAILAREVVGEGVSVLLLHCHPEDWDGQLAAVFAPRPPIAYPRRRYIGRVLRYDWRADVPQGFTVQRADNSLLERAGLEIPEDVRDVLEMCGPGDDPAQKGFGFVAFHQGQIVAHAVVDCIVGDAGDMGLFTHEDYRRRGLATLTAAAAVEYGLAHGLNMVNWDCGEDNVGSLRTAEKLGFERERDHTLYLWSFDETRHMLGLAQRSMDEGRYRDSLDVCEKMLAQQEHVPPYAYHMMACTWAKLGHPDKAFEHLHNAVDKGWTDVSYTQDREEFKPLHDQPQWAAVLERMRQNREK